jgi:hypothetical protein
MAQLALQIPTATQHLQLVCARAQAKRETGGFLRRKHRPQPGHLRSRHRCLHAERRRKTGRCVLSGQHRLQLGLLRRGYWSMCAEPQEAILGRSLRHKYRLRLGHLNRATVCARDVDGRSACAKQFMADGWNSRRLWGSYRPEGRAARAPQAAVGVLPAAQASAANQHHIGLADAVLALKGRLRMSENAHF